MRNFGCESGENMTQVTKTHTRHQSNIRLKGLENIPLISQLHSLTPWIRVLQEKLTVSQLVKKLPIFNGTRRLVAASTNARHLSLF